MKLFSLTSTPATIITTSVSSRRNFLVQENCFFSTQTLTHPNARKFRCQASGFVSGSIKSSSIKTVEIQQETNLKDGDLVFVAGATGKVGSRTVRELLKLGFRVIAGVRSSQKVEQLVQSVQQMKLEGKAAAVEKLKIVECDLERDKIEPVIGNASVVICCIGASEKEIFDVTGPYRIDYQATKNLIDAATAAGVDHFILLTSLGTNKIGFPAAILNLFWGVLFWKRKAEEALLASGLPYAIVRPGGMERPTDTYKETHNVTLALEDTLFGGQVSNLQVAELIAFMAKNRSLSYCKVLEVIAETTAPLTPMGELLLKVPSQRVDRSVPKEPQATPKPDPVPSPSILSEASSIVTDKEPSKTAVQFARHLSPYTMYEDLKPPTSPTPTPSTSPSTIKDRYDDLKPPTTPSPTAPSELLVSTYVTVGESQMSSNSVTSTKPPPSEDKAQDKDHLRGPKSRPLSPFTVYEDLKPPSSPSKF